MTDVPLCPICHDECGGACEKWREYWDSLTPEERRDEERMMDEYVAESEAQDWAL